MSEGFVLALMVFCHIVDDYYLQGILSQMKQRSWWAANTQDPIYKFDWIMAMAMHAFSWAFMIMLPFAIQCRFQPTSVYFVLLILNAAVHFWTDNLKANKRVFNLVLDQSIHLTQILVTWAAMLEV